MYALMCGKLVVTEIRVQMEPDFETEFQRLRLTGARKRKGRKEKEKKGKNRAKAAPAAWEGVRLDEQGEVREGLVGRPLGP